MAKRYKYKGVLSERLPLAMPLRNWFDPSLELDSEALATIEERRRSLWDALFKDCGVERTEPDAWRHLAEGLAARHVDAFMPAPEKQPGRPVEYSEDDKRRITHEVHELVCNGMSTASAARDVAGRWGRRKDDGEAFKKVYERTLRDWKKADASLKALIEEWKLVV